MRQLFGWVPVDDRAYDRAWQVQRLLTERGWHRSAGPVDLVPAATAELRGLTLLHRDHDFDRMAAVTGQALQWYGPEAGKWSLGR
ncbi:PIN domain-containing protein [Streptosporangium amethystogenes]|uniref:PIN domain-containing protein n=1 Tax=Streptosporangium amethystogenes TaxID=2002 RepID=UPI0037A42FF5